MRIKHLGNVEICSIKYDRGRATVRLDHESNLNFQGRQFAAAVGDRINHVTTVTGILTALVLDLDVDDPKDVKRVTQNFLNGLKRKFEGVSDEQITGFTSHHDLNEGMAVDGELPNIYHR